MEKSSKSLIEALKNKRQKLGLSLRKLSEQIGVSFSTLSRLERDGSEPDNNTRIRIINWLGDEARELGIDHMQVAMVHFRAAKNIDSKLVKSLVKVSRLVQKQFLKS